MYSRAEIENLWNKYFRQEQYEDKPLLLDGPYIAHQWGTLWGGSQSTYIYNHQSFSRSGQSFISVACFPDSDRPIFVEVHAHHEGTDSGVVKLDSLKTQLTEYSEAIQDWCEELDKDPTLLQDPAQNFDFKELMLLYGMCLQTYEICKLYSEDSEELRNLPMAADLEHWPEDPKITFFKMLPANKWEALLQLNPGKESTIAQLRSCELLLELLDPHQTEAREETQKTIARLESELTGIEVVALPKTRAPVKVDALPEHLQKFIIP